MMKLLLECSCLHLVFVFLKHLEGLVGQDVGHREVADLK